MKRPVQHYEQRHLSRHASYRSRLVHDIARRKADFNSHKLTPASQQKPLSKNIAVQNSEDSGTQITTRDSQSKAPIQNNIDHFNDIDESVLTDVSASMHKPHYYSHALKMSVQQHIGELRKRLQWCVIALLIGGMLGYKFQDQIINFLVKPLGKTLYYSSPTGGFDFIIKICLFFGFLITIPVIIYNFLKFISPAVPANISYHLSKLVVSSVLLALGGIAFAYFVSLPAALNFLNTITNSQIQALISAQEYFNFVMIYLAGFAVLFQMPLIIYFFNKVTPIHPSKLIKKQRIVILVSFIIAAILTPTPDPINQVLMAVPIIALYQASIVVIWYTQKYSKQQVDFELA